MPALLFALGCAVFSLNSIAASPAEIRIVGSDLLGGEFSKALYDFATQERIRLALALDGSRPGVAELRAGRADLALLSLPAEEELADAAYEVWPVGYHAIVVLVPTACALEHITFAQLGGIFGRSGAAPIERWGDLGLSGDWAASPIVALAPETGANFTVDYFRHVVLRGRALKSEISRYATEKALAHRFKGDSRVIALASRVPPEAPEMKLLAVAADARSGPQLPTPESLSNGQYPLGLALRVVFRREGSMAIRPILRFLFSEAAASHLERAALVPIPRTMRAQQLAAVEKMVR